MIKPITTSTIMDIRKYIATSKHPVLKQGTVLRKNGGVLIALTDGSYIKFEIPNFEDWINNGFIELEEKFKNKKADLSLNAVHKSVARCLNKQMEFLHEKHREGRAPYIKKLFCYFAKKYTNYSLKDIGNYVFKGYDHSSVIAASKWIEIRFEDINFKGVTYDVLEIKKYLNL